MLADSSEDLVGAKDLVSITTLSVSIPPRGAIWLLSEEGQSEVTALLKLIPPDVDIWEPAAGSLFENHSTLHQLWELIGEANWPRRRKGGGFGGVTKRSKLLAAKRPRLMPVVDGVIRSSLGLSPDPWDAFAQYGRCLHQLLARKDLREKFQSALDHASVPSRVPLLRRIDIVIWKNNVDQR